MTGLAPLQKLQTTIRTLIKNGETVNLPEIFLETGVNNRIEGEKLFKKAIEDMIRQPYDSPSKLWAKTIKGEGYRFLQSRALAAFWKELAIQRTADVRLQHFYADEAETFEQVSKRQKIYPTNTTAEDHEDDIADKSENRPTDEEISTTYVHTWAKLMSEKDVSESHLYSLERSGIIQCGVGIKRLNDVPGHVYDQIALIPEKPVFPFKQISQYITSVLRMKEYGTPSCDTMIFSKSSIEHEVDDATFTFISRMLFQFSNYIHNVTHPTQITDSETAYCHEAIWPMLRCAAHTVHGLKCDFKVGETQLRALKEKDGPNYNADGIVLAQTSKLEILLLEASGALGTLDRHRHVFDHVKGAYGCHAMIVRILEKHPYADKTLIEKVQVLFVHTSARDDKIRVWVMKPQCMGRVISFERVKSCAIPRERTDTNALRGVIEFFWIVKELLADSLSSIKALQKSNDDNIFNIESASTVPLVSLLKPMPLKPDKKRFCGGMVDLDPTSFTM